jgi:hypothetical protein
MPSSVHLTFVSPDRRDLTKLHIYESMTQVDIGTVIETVTAVGSYPDYINEYTTNMAASVANWFRIQWEDSKGAKTEISAAVQGNTETLVGKVVGRVLQRDHQADENVVTQEAEAVIEKYLAVTDPYDPTIVVSYETLNGLVYLTLARTYLSSAISQGTVESATLGLVSFRSSTGSARTIDVQALIDLANSYLGIGTSLVLQMAEVISTTAWIEALEA